MTNSYILIFFSIFLVSLLSLVGVALLTLGNLFNTKLMLFLVSFSTGALLGNVFVHLLPEITAESSDPARGFFLVLVGIVLSFMIEKFIHWRHCHDTECETHVHPVGPLILIGDAAHNMIDGVLIATSYLVSVPLGIATTTAVILHEIPQEIGDFALLVHSGFSEKKALFMNFLSALTALLGAVLVLTLSKSIDGIETVLLPFAAGNFLYIAGSDLIPELHKETRLRRAFIQLLCMVAGIGLMYSLTFIGEPSNGNEQNIGGEEQVEGITLRGVIERAERPASDISYDYRIRLEEPYADPLNAFGEVETSWFYLISDEDLEDLIGQNVEVAGAIEWGYAELRVFHAEIILSHEE